MPDGPEDVTRNLLLAIAERLSLGERVVIDIDQTGKATITATTTDTSI